VTVEKKERYNVVKYRSKEDASGAQEIGGN
jgi:hypothetical protein